MLRSMFAGISGLRSHQTMMDVVGNNIANVNTHGFKSSRATFQDALYQAQRGATGGVAADEGGVNPTQIGLGSNIAATDQNFGQGALQPTGRSTDAAITGDGFFSLDNGNFTRAGTFNWDSAGNLVTPGGDIVQGATAGGDPADLDPINVDPDLLNSLRDISIGQDGTITGRDEDGELEELGQIATVTFVNPNGLNRIGDSQFAASAASGDPVAGAPGVEGRGGLEGGALEMSNVDLAEEFTGLIMAQRGFQANARTITTSDELLQELVNIKR